MTETSPWVCSTSDETSFFIPAEYAPGERFSLELQESSFVNGVPVRIDTIVDATVESVDDEGTATIRWDLGPRAASIAGREISHLPSVAEDPVNFNGVAPLIYRVTVDGVVTEIVNEDELRLLAEGQIRDHVEQLPEHERDLGEQVLAGIDFLLDVTIQDQLGYVAQAHVAEAMFYSIDDTWVVDYDVPVLGDVVMPVSGIGTTTRSAGGCVVEVSHTTLDRAGGLTRILRAVAESYEIELAVLEEMDPADVYDLVVEERIVIDPATRHVLESAIAQEITAVGEVTRSMLRVVRLDGPT